MDISPSRTRDLTTAVLTGHQNCRDYLIDCLKRSIWSGQITSHNDRKEVYDTARLLSYVAATTQAGPADEDPPHCSHVAARHDPERAS